MADNAADEKNLFFVATKEVNYMNQIWSHAIFEWNS